MARLIGGSGIVSISTGQDLLIRDQTRSSQTNQKKKGIFSNIFFFFHSLHPSPPLTTLPFLTKWMAFDCAAPRSQCKHIQCLPHSHPPPLNYTTKRKMLFSRIILNSFDILKNSFNRNRNRLVLNEGVYNKKKKKN